MARRRMLSDCAVLMWALGAGTVVIALSQSWGYPIGIHDPWLHINALRTVQLNPAKTVYPFAYSLLLAVQRVTEMGFQPLVQLIPYVALAVGVCSAAALGRRFTGCEARQTVILLTPTVTFAKFIPRPFTLALVIVIQPERMGCGRGRGAVSEHRLLENRRIMKRMLIQESRLTELV